MKIIRKKLTVNEKTYETFPHNGTNFTSLTYRLQAEFKTQGDFYKAIYGVDHKIAELAGWRPENASFFNHCNGWRNFIKDKGIIKSEEIIEEVDISDILFKND